MSKTNGNGKKHIKNMRELIQETIPDLQATPVKGFAMVSEPGNGVWAFEAPDGQTYHLRPIRDVGLATCSSCGVAFKSKRAPVAGRNRFCKKCGKPAALRIAAQKYRERKKAAAAEEAH